MIMTFNSILFDYPVFSLSASKVLDVFVCVFASFTRSKTIPKLCLENSKLNVKCRWANHYIKTNETNIFDCFLYKYTLLRYFKISNKRVELCSNFWELLDSCYVSYKVEINNWGGS